MKLLLQMLATLLICGSLFSQNIEVKSLEYIWSRQGGDNRKIVAYDSSFVQILKRSFIDAITNKWKMEAPDFEVKISKLPSLKSQPKFSTSVTPRDSSKQYIFLQLFDEPLTVDLSKALYAARINVRYRLISGADGATLDDKTTLFNITATKPTPGAVLIRRYPFHPSRTRDLCDSIASGIINEPAAFGREIKLGGVCAYEKSSETDLPNKQLFQIDTRRQAYSVSGNIPFTIVHNSVNISQTGKKRHAGENTAMGLLTLFSNIDTDKKRSVLLSADHTFSDGTNTYHALINYIDTKVAERRRQKDENGYKSIEVGEYQYGWREINPHVRHTIISGTDTTSFTIQFRKVAEQFTQMWDGLNTATVESLPAAFNNVPKAEMLMNGNIGKDTLTIATSDGGVNKKMQLNGETVLRWNSRTAKDGVITYGNINERQLKTAVLLCMIIDRYYQN